MHMFAERLVVLGIAAAASLILLPVTVVGARLPTGKTGAACVF